MNLVLFFILIIMFFKVKNTITTIIIFFMLCYFVEVIFVEDFFSKPFSEKAILFDSLNDVTYSLIIFTIIFYIFNYRLNDDIKFKTNFKDFKYVDVFISSILFLFAAYTYYSNNIVNGGDYHMIAMNKTPLDEYLIPLITVILIFTRGRFLISISFLSIALIYGISGERLKMFMYFFTFYLIFKNSYKFISFKFLLVVALVMAMLISLYRSNLSLDTFSEMPVHISHFGEVTISSMYLIEFSSNFSIFDKINHSIGILIANLLPSSLIPLDLDLKRSLIQYAKIPGGGWLPVWIYSLGGYLLVAIVSIIISLFSRFIHIKLYKTNENSRVYILYLSIYIMFLINVNNWFMYTPYQLFKFPIYIAIILLITYSLFTKNYKGNI